MSLSGAIAALLEARPLPDGGGTTDVGALHAAIESLQAQK
jgi:hypothetical protein